MNYEALYKKLKRYSETSVYSVIKVMRIKKWRTCYRFSHLDRQICFYNLYELI